MKQLGEKMERKKATPQPSRTALIPHQLTVLSTLSLPIYIVHPFIITARISKLRGRRDELVSSTGETELESTEIWSLKWQYFIYKSVYQEMTLSYDMCIVYTGIRKTRGCGIFVVLDLDLSSTKAFNSWRRCRPRLRICFNNYQYR